MVVSALRWSNVQSFTAAKTFTLHGRDEARSIEVGGDRVHFGTGGAAVQTLDLDSGSIARQPCRSA